jgi:uncharacterized membrane protein
MTGLSYILIDWAELLIRWLHVIAGIAWIGSSFYFIHLDLSLKQREHLPEQAYGDAWQVHGGGFYHMVKYLVAPKQMPDELTWFKWEAYATWLSGMALLAVVYYLAAELYLIDTHVLALAPWQAVLISLTGLVAGWVIYDQLCRLSGADDRLLLGIGFVFLVGAAFFFTQIFSARGAFMEIGALIGTMMVANVAMVIIPGQRKVVAALLKGETPDPAFGKRGKQRSLHNNYLTLPVVFVMIGNHYPFVYATQWSWAILALVIVIGVVLRHFYNSRHKGLPSPWWTWGVAAACVVAAIWLSTIATNFAGRPEVLISRPPVTLAEAQNVIAGRCSMCHAAEPGWPGVHRAPKGLLLETAEQIDRNAHKIASFAIWSHAMPPGNVTEIEPEERYLLDRWLRTKGLGLASRVN